LHPRHRGGFEAEIAPLLPSAWEDYQRAPSANSYAELIGVGLCSPMPENLFNGEPDVFRDLAKQDWRDVAAISRGLTAGSLVTATE
jgi:hypothetical protein